MQKMDATDALLFYKSLILFAVWSWWGVSCFHVDFQMVWWIPVRIPQALASFMGFSKGGAFLNSPRLCCAKICRYSVRRICRWGGEVCHLEGCFQETSCYIPAPPSSNWQVRAWKLMVGRRFLSFHFQGQSASFREGTYHLDGVFWKFQAQVRANHIQTDEAWKRKWKKAGLGMELEPLPLRKLELD